MNTSPIWSRADAFALLAACATLTFCTSCVDLSGTARHPNAALPVGTPDVSVPESPTTLANGWLPAKAWQQVAPIPFAFLDGTGDQPQAPTLCRVATKDGLLLLRVECREPDMAHLVYTTAGHDSASIWRDDSIEIYLQPGDGAPVHHLIVNAAGGRFDAVTPPNGAEDVSWDPPLRVRTFIETNRWTAELVVPLAAFVTSNAAPGTASIWRGNFARARPGREGAFAEDTGWRITHTLGAGNPAFFGRLHLQTLREKFPLQTAQTVAAAPPNPLREVMTAGAMSDLLRAKFGQPVALLGGAPTSTALLRLRPLAKTYVGSFEPTEVHVGRQTNAFVITVHCTEHAPLPPDVGAASRAIWDGDCVEIFLAPDRKESGDYLHVIASPDGKSFRGRGVKEAAVAGVEITAARDATAWTAAIRIPDSAFALAPGRTPALWGLNVTRNRAARRGEAQQTTVWSRFLWSAHEPSTFGTLWLWQGDTFPDLGDPNDFPELYRKGRALWAQVEPAEHLATYHPPLGINPDVFDAAEREQLALPTMVCRQMNQVRQAQFAARDAAWAQVQTSNDVVQLKARLRAGFARSVGGFPERTASLNPRVSVVFEDDDVRIERLIYDSQPRFPVTANLFVPKHRQGRRLPVVVRIEGHTTNGRFAGLTFSEDLARSGYLVMNIDLPGQGELIYVNNGFGSRTPTSNHYAEGAGCVLPGGNLAGVMIYDVRRGLDYLETREEADMRRVVLTGASGGGTVTAYVTALDDRIAAAAPVSACNSARGEAGGSSDSEQVLADAVTAALDIEGFAAMAAPRPYCVITEASPETRARTETSFALARRFYTLLGADSSRLQYVPTREPHGYGKGHVQQFRRWLAQVMPADPDGPGVKGKMPYDRNACTASRSGRAFFSRDVPACETIFSLNHKRAALGSAFDKGVTTPDVGRVRAAQIRTWLLQRFGLPEGGVDPLQVQSRGTNTTAQAMVERLVFTTDEGIVVPALLLSPKEDATAPAMRRPVVVWISSRGKRGVLEQRADAVAGLLAAGDRVLIPDVRGIGETAADADDTFMGAETDLNGLGIEVGHPLIGQRVKDVLACVRHLRTRPDVEPGRIALLGDSPSGCNAPLIRQPRLNTDAGLEPFTQAESLGPVLALLSAALDPQIAACATIGLPSAYADVCRTPYFMHPFSIFVPGILQTCDIADLCAAVAPRPLLVAGSVNGMNQRLDPVRDPAHGFSRAQRGYDLAGAASQFVVAPAADAETVAVELGQRLRR